MKWWVYSEQSRERVRQLKFEPINESKWRHCWLQMMSRMMYPYYPPSPSMDTSYSTAGGCTSPTAPAAGGYSTPQPLLPQLLQHHYPPLERREKAKEETQEKEDEQVSTYFSYFSLHYLLFFKKCCEWTRVLLRCTLVWFFWCCCCHETVPFWTGYIIK